MVAQLRSPNFGERTSGIDMLVLHYTGMRSAEAALRWLCNPRSSVSAHYLVFEDGRVVQMVDETRRAWHAGKSFWAGETDINSRSIGIEIANPGHQFGYLPFPDEQIKAVIRLCREISDRHAILPRRVLAHSDVAPERKEDPGELFPWDRLHRHGVGRWVTPEAVEDGPSEAVGTPAGDLANRFREYGYGFGDQSETADRLTAIVTAFQRHFRPSRVDGVADRSTVATLDRLLAELPAA